MSLKTVTVSPLSLKTVTLSPINDVLLSRGKSVTTDVQEYESVNAMVDEKCYILPKNINGLRENEEKKIRQRKGNLNKVKGKRKHCKTLTCSSDQSRRWKIQRKWVQNNFWMFLCNTPWNHQKFYNCGGVEWEQITSFTQINILN